MVLNGNKIQIDTAIFTEPANLPAMLIVPTQLIIYKNPADTLVRDPADNDDRLSLRWRAVRVAAPDFDVAAFGKRQRKERADRLRRRDHAHRLARRARFVHDVALDPREPLLFEKRRRVGPGLLVCHAT